MRIITFILILLSSVSAFAQQGSVNDTITFVANFYTRQSNSMSGTYNKKTSDGEKGEVVISTSNNIKCIVTPPDLKINPNEDKTWQGFIMPDDISIPIPGTSDYGWLAGSFDLTYKTSNTEDPFSEPVLVNSKGTESIHFMIYSINVDFDCSEDVYLFPGQSLNVNSITFPSGGNYHWNSAEGITTSGNENSYSINVLPMTGVSEGSIKLTYDIKGVSFTKVLHVHVVQPNIPDLILVDSSGTEVHILPQSNNSSYSFTFNPIGEGFYLNKNAEDGFLISTSSQIINLDVDPFSANNLFFQVNKNLGYQYPNISNLEIGQDENAPLPVLDVNSQPTTPQDNSGQVSNLKYSTEPNPLNAEKFFVRPITIALKSNPSVVLGKVIVKLN